MSAPIASAENHFFCGVLRFAGEKAFLIQNGAILLDGRLVIAGLGFVFGVVQFLFDGAFALFHAVINHFVQIIDRA